MYIGAFAVRGPHGTTQVFCAWLNHQAWSGMVWQPVLGHVHYHVAKCMVLMCSDPASLEGRLNP